MLNPKPPTALSPRFPVMNQEVRNDGVYDHSGQQMDPGKGDLGGPPNPDIKPEVRPYVIKETK